MIDFVVTVPIDFRYDDEPGLRGLDAWVSEGDAPGTEWSGTDWVFNVRGRVPEFEPGARLYVVCEDRLRGYSPIVRVDYGMGEVEFIRRGGAVAVTIPERITGFRGWRERWWHREDEVPFPDWLTVDRRHEPPGRLFAAAEAGG